MPSLASALNVPGTFLEKCEAVLSLNPACSIPSPLAMPECLQVAAPLSYLACETPCCDGQNSLLVEHRQADSFRSIQSLMTAVVPFEGCLHCFSFSGFFKHLSYSSLVSSLVSPVPCVARFFTAFIAFIHRRQYQLLRAVFLHSPHSVFTAPASTITGPPPPPPPPPPLHHHRHHRCHHLVTITGTIAAISVAVTTSIIIVIILGSMITIHSEGSLSGPSLAFLNQDPNPSQARCRGRRSVSALSRVPSPRFKTPRALRQGQV